MEKICGVYKIVSPTGKIYVGQSHNIRRRWHSYHSISSKKQPALYQSFLKHGINAHKFDILNICIDDQDLLNKLEIFWMDYYNVLDSSVGLNCRPGGSKGKLSDETKRKISSIRKGKFTKKDNPFYGRSHSIDTINKIIESNKRRKLTGENKNNKRSFTILQYSMDDKFIKEFPSAAEVKRELGFDKSCILNCCHGKSKSSYGYKWKIKKDYYA